MPMRAAKALIVGCLSMAATASATALHLPDQLTLAPYVPAAQSDEPTIDLASLGEVYANDPALPDAALSLKYRSPSQPAPRISGVGYQKLVDIDTVTYRTGAGTGFGLATMPGLVLTQGLVTRGGFRLSLYYVFSAQPINAILPRESQDDMTVPAESAIGIRMGWKF